MLTKPLQDALRKGKALKIAMLAFTVKGADEKPEVVRRATLTAKG